MISMEAFSNAVAVSGDASPYQNADIIPLPPSRRTWTKKIFAFFWISTAINIAEWSGASTALAVGLTVGQALAVNAISTVIIAIMLVINGQGGGRWHVPFAILNRTGWGIRGSWFVLLNRIILSCCWYGVQSWYGGQMVKIMIGSIWPSFYNMKNTFGPNAGMQTNEFIGFIIFWTVSLPIFFLRPERYRIPAIASSVIVTIAAIATFIWALVKQGDIGPLWKNPEQVYGIGRLSGSELSWTMMRMISSGIGAWAGGIMYQSDFSRYAVNDGDQVWGQIFAIPLCLFGSNLLGIITTSCARGLYPDEPLLWRLYDLFEAIQTHGGPGARAAVFFAATAFFLSQLSVTVVACGTVGGIDLAALLPRFLDIRRGSFVVAAVGILINPWKILNTANSFISAMAAYGVFLAPLTGIMVAEYYLVRHQRLKLSHLYIPDSSSQYWYWHGLNWRAPVVWAVSVWPCLPGFAASVTPASVIVSDTWMHVYYMSWLLEFFISGTLWAVWNWLAPPPGRGDVDEKDVFGTSGPPKEDSEESVDEKDEYVAMEDEYVAMEDGQL
ncbi:NCS1 nucleoside transporter family [Fomitopsis betulina]|nr:NCS1 nucleoside transporter family [Fomitopsis betulina]